jgi:hypothetical protein
MDKIKKHKEVHLYKKPEIIDTFGKDEDYKTMTTVLAASSAVQLLNGSDLKFKQNF